MGRANSFRKHRKTALDGTELGKLLSTEKRVTQEWYWRMCEERPWGKWTRDYFAQQFAQLSLQITSLQERGAADSSSAPDE